MSCGIEVQPISVFAPFFCSNGLSSISNCPPALPVRTKPSADAGLAPRPVATKTKPAGTNPSRRMKRQRQISRRMGRLEEAGGRNEDDVARLQDNVFVEILAPQDILVIWKFDMLILAIGAVTNNADTTLGRVRCQAASHAQGLHHRQRMGGDEFAWFRHLADDVDDIAIRSLDDDGHWCIGNGFFETRFDFVLHLAGSLAGRLDGADQRKG